MTYVSYNGITIYFFQSFFQVPNLGFGGEVKASCNSEAVKSVWGIHPSLINLASSRVLLPMSQSLERGIASPTGFYKKMTFPPACYSGSLNRESFAHLFSFIVLKLFSLAGMAGSCFLCSLGPSTLFSCLPMWARVCLHAGWSRSEGHRGLACHPGLEGHCLLSQLLLNQPQFCSLADYAKCKTPTLLCNWDLDLCPCPEILFPWDLGYWDR